MSLSREAKALLAAMRRGSGTVERQALGGWMTPEREQAEGHTVYELVRARIAEYTEWGAAPGHRRIGVKARLVKRQEAA